MNTRELLLKDLRKKLKKKKTFRDKLNKEDLQHLKETTENSTLKGLKINLVAQKKDNIRCSECEQIAKKTGIGGITMAYAEIRKQRRSFEEKLRRDLLFLECENKEKESKELIAYLENELYKEMAKYAKYCF